MVANFDYKTDYLPAQTDKFEDSYLLIKCNMVLKRPMNLKKSVK